MVGHSTSRIHSLTGADRGYDAPSPSQSVYPHTQFSVVEKKDRLAYLEDLLTYLKEEKKDRLVYLNDACKNIFEEEKEDECIQNFKKYLKDPTNELKVWIKDLLKGNGESTLTAKEPQLSEEETSILKKLEEKFQSKCKIYLNYEDKEKSLPSHQKNFQENSGAIEAAKEFLETLTDYFVIKKFLEKKKTEKTAYLKDLFKNLEKGNTEKQNEHMASDIETHVLDKLLDYMDEVERKNALSMCTE